MCGSATDEVIELPLPFYNTLVVVTLTETNQL